MTKATLQNQDQQRLISFLKSQTWCKQCEIYYDPAIFVEHMRKAHNEIIKVKEQKKQDENYWICPIHQKKLSKFGRCEKCGLRIVVMIRKKEFKSWLKDMKFHNDHVHQWIRSKFSEYWFDFHCLFCNKEPQEVGIHELQDILIDYQGKEVKIDSN